MQLGLIKSDVWDFGKKYKGYKIQDIPTDYFNWLVFETEIGGLELKRAMEELDKRGEGSNYINGINGESQETEEMYW